MKTLIISLFLLVTSLSAFSQSADELNERSKQYLANNDVEAALPLLKKAAELGNAEAQYNYGVCFKKGLGAPQNDETANEWFLKAANQGWPNAQSELAYNLREGLGIAQDDQKAFQWLLKCAEQSDPRCMFQVADRYRFGRGTEKSIDSMMVWIHKIGALENPEDWEVSGNITLVRFELAKMYRDGGYAPKDLTRSYSWILLYNESKKDINIYEQKANIRYLKEIEKELTKAQMATAKNIAEECIGRPLRNLSNLYKQQE